MPLEVEPRHRATPRARDRRTHTSDARAIVIGLINNMPDPALEATEGQFGGLLRGAATSHTVRLRFSCLPEVRRGPKALAHIKHTYWSLEELMSQSPDALIITGTEPHAPSLTDEPYWTRLVALVNWAEANTVSSVWSCLAAHAAVQVLDGVPRQSLEQKRFGVFAHEVISGHPLVRDVEAPLWTPHSRWNDLRLADLRSAGYVIVSWSCEAGPNLFVKQRRSLFVFFQGHPEYERTTLFKEYRRDVGRFLSGQRLTYPDLPCGCLTDRAAAILREFQARSMRQHSVDRSCDFPDHAANGTRNTWRAAALKMYRNWLSLVANAKLSAGAGVAAEV